MIVAVDVDYRESEVVAAAVGFAGWTATEPSVEVVVRTDAPPAPYEPGRFYRRELPHLRSVLALVDARADAPSGTSVDAPSGTSVDAVVVDGYVWLAAGKPGLGAHLHAALGGAIPVVGVAKTAYAGATAVEVVRGTSARPLYVTAIGLDAADVASHVRAMAGEHRIPTLLRRVDQLCRAR